MIPVAQFAEIVNGEFVREYPNNIEPKLPSMGISRSDEAKIKREAKEFREAEAAKPSMIAVNQTPILQSLRNADPALSTKATQVFQNLQNLQNDIADLQAALNAQLLPDLQAALEAQYQLCRQLLDASEKMPVKINRVKSTLQDCQRSVNRLGAALTQVRGQCPPASKYPTDLEISNWQAKVDEAESAYACVVDRLQGFVVKLAELEREAQEKQFALSLASQEFVKLRERVSAVQKL
jgi:chromosome segregation ATPase